MLLVEAAGFDGQQLLKAGSRAPKRLAEHAAEQKLKYQATASGGHCCSPVEKAT